MLLFPFPCVYICELSNGFILLHGHPGIADVGELKLFRDRMLQLTLPINATLSPKPLNPKT